eukprot:CAMPEP_0202402238 /NCGR_PEP_ID=MMETSP1128-20130828/4092_1 /ASSEMBLY_ACC=CAM_ASM_000463 /TAXON_ID=3047 /ORGANISM="Dunaliella tertiolecta, Strain CCMP1320" /LENGTH=89 /DNA_ID=CAMNT_0049006235 /DNA_START=370 /DNA_END=639 /DNA_ORIENTATION=-
MGQAQFEGLHAVLACALVHRSVAVLRGTILALALVSACMAQMGAWQVHGLVLLGLCLLQTDAPSLPALLHLPCWTGPEGQLGGLVWHEG